MTGQGEYKLTHLDLQPKRTEKDEGQLNSLVEIMDSHWIIPFEPDQMDLACGKVAPPEIAKELEAEVGKVAYE